MNLYLERYAYPQQQLHSEPAFGTELIIVIPCYKEKALMKTIYSLQNCTLPSHHTEVIVVFNGSENDSEEVNRVNRDSFEEFDRWLDTQELKSISFHTICCFELPKKHAGVGLARKIGMDEAVRRFEMLGNKNGVILCTDADTLFPKNYLVEISNYFHSQPKIQACSIHYEHPIDEDNSQEIIAYELHLRYYIEALRYAGHPHAYHTIGSSMAVRTLAYQRQGGMNKRKAGEDFYFLHKLIPNGNFGEITRTHTIPSPRLSDRVPFGTGKAMNDQKNQTSELLSYNPKIFDDLKQFLMQVPSLYKHDISHLPDSVELFLNEQYFTEILKNIRLHSSSVSIFTNRFYRWFNGFKVLKYTHLARDCFYPNVSITTAAATLIEEKELNTKELLLYYRQIQKQHATHQAK